MRSRSRSTGRCGGSASCSRTSGSRSSRSSGRPIRPCKGPAPSAGTGVESVDPRGVYMKGFNHRDDLEARLRAERPEPRPEFLASVADQVRSDRQRARSGGLRLAFAGGLTAALLVALASVGGLSYAATSSTHVLAAVKNVVVPKQKASSVGESSAAAQYGHKVLICHKGHTISVDQHAVPAHLRHGDSLGACGTSGVKGASASRGLSGRGGGSGDPSGGVLGATATSGSLPFTGTSLGVAVLVALILLTSGIALHRRARRN